MQRFGRLQRTIFNTVSADPVDVTVGFFLRSWYWRKYQWRQKKLAGGVPTFRQETLATVQPINNAGDHDARRNCFSGRNNVISDRVLHQFGVALGIQDLHDPVFMKSDRVGSYIQRIRDFLHRLPFRQ
jgi:hypothetical protein